MAETRGELYDVTICECGDKNVFIVYLWYILILIILIILCIICICIYIFCRRKKDVEEKSIEEGTKKVVLQFLEDQ